MALTQDQAAALDAARALAAAGVPVFVAAPDPSSKTGFALPVGWQNTEPDPAVVERWAPGMALCAVMGRGVDLLDIDPRNGADPGVLNGSTPTSYAVASTPSGGMHAFVASMGVGSRDNIAPGIDVKAGAPDGSGRGFAFLAPTVKPSKVTGEPAAYRWVSAPDIERLRAAWAQGDPSGAALAARIRDARGSGSVMGRTVGPSAGPYAWWTGFLASREPQSAPAAERAIAEKLDEVASWEASSGAGFRQVLMRAAMTLGGYVGSGWLDETDAWARLEAAAVAVWGAADEDDRRWIQQGLTDGQHAPFHVYTAEDERRFGDAAAAVPEGVPTGPVWSPQRALGVEAFDPAGASHDQEHAEAVLARNAPVRRYGVDSGTWLVRRRFERWSELPDQAEAAIADVARLMPLGQGPVPTDVTARTEANWQAHRRNIYLSSAGAGRISRKVKALVTGGDHPCCVDIADLDADREVLWAGGYPFDLRASSEVPTLAAIHPDTPHLHTAAVAPDHQAPTPAFDAFLAAVFPDPELRTWAIRVLAIALTGYADAALPVLYGPERTGKTSLVELLVRVLGTYGHAADPRLLAGAEHTHASVVYALKGRRLSFIDEGPRRGHLAAERLKQLTGGGQLTGNAMRSNPVTFSPTHTLVMTTNDEPPITDPALRARVRLVPCDADQADVRAARQGLTERVWAAEAPGVLAMLMREAAAWLAAPDSAGTAAAPVQVRGLLDEMTAGQDPVKEWVELATVPSDPGTPGRELYRRFVEWHEAQALYRRQSAPSETLFGRRLTDLGFPAVKHADYRRRPLSVLNGGPGAPAGPMTAPGFLADAGTGSGGFVAGWSTVPATTDNPRSTPVSSTTDGGLASSSRSMNQNNEALLHKEQYTEKNMGNRGATSNPPDLATTNGTSPATMAPPAGSAPTRPEDRHAGPGRVGSPGSDDLADQSPAVAARREAATVNRQTAAKADGEGTSRTEARKAVLAQRRAEKIAAAIAEVCGEVHRLPAVVDRDGHVLPVTPDQAAAVVRAALGRQCTCPASGVGHLTVDVETSGYPIGHELYELRSVQLGDAFAVAILHPVGHAGLIGGLLASATVLHAHSATADLAPLDHAGLLERLGGAAVAWTRMFDTVLPAKLADPASTGSDPGLKKLAPAVLGPHAVVPGADEARATLFKAGKWLTEIKVETPVEKSGWAQVETGCETMLRYAGSDVLDTSALAMSLPVPDPGVLARERLAQRMTAPVAHRGVRLDPERVAELTLRHTTEREDVRAAVRAFGVDNPGSDQQVATKALELGAQLPQTATGRPSVAAGVLDPLKAAPGALGEFVRGVLSYRHHDTVLGLFLAPYAQLCEHGDGRARPTVYTIGTNTGRMSCVRPNLQQLPREGGVRSCLVADPGMTIISADFSGVELRVAAALSSDPNLRQIIAAEDAFNAEVTARATATGDASDEGQKAARAAILAERGWPHAGVADGLHWLIARQIWGDGASKAQRYIAKRIVFGRIYGGGVTNLSAQVGVTTAVGQQVLDTLDAITPTLAQWSREVSNAVKAGHTRYPSYSGRMIHMPRQTPHAAPNYAIQGSARELLVDALGRWADTRWADCTLFPVHDELVIFVPAEDGEAATAELGRAMAGELGGVPIVAEPDAPSTYWRDST